MTPAEFARLARLPHAEAIAFMRQRTRDTVTLDYMDLARGEHATQFTVSRLARLDLLADVHRAVERSVDGDLSRQDFVRDVRQILAAAGWWGDIEIDDPDGDQTLPTRFDNRRLRLIYDTNLRSAHAAGQWARIERNKTSHPYVRYITQRDGRVRPEHREWDNLVLPVDHEFWHTHLPPNGYRCRCRVVAMTQAEVEAGGALSQTPGGGYQYDPDTGEVLRGADGQPLYTPPQRIPFKTTAPKLETRVHENRRTGEVREVPVGIDPGFDHNPGRPGGQSLDALIRQKLAAAPPGLAQAAREDGFTLPAGPAVMAAITPRPKLDGDARAWVLGEGRKTGLEHLLVYDSETGRVLGQAKGEPNRVRPPEKVLTVLDDRNASLVLHHNHPDSVSLSPADLAILTRAGVVRVVAHGHDGSIYEAMHGKHMYALARALEGMSGVFKERLQEIERRRIDTLGIRAHIRNLALHEAGMIRYRAVLAADNARLYEDQRVYFDGIAAMLAEFLRRYHHVAD